MSIFRSIWSYLFKCRKWKFQPTVYMMQGTGRVERVWQVLNILYDIDFRGAVRLFDALWINSVAEISCFQNSYDKCQPHFPNSMKGRWKGNELRKTRMRYGARSYLISTFFYTSPPPKKKKWKYYKLCFIFLMMSSFLFFTVIR